MKTNMKLKPDKLADALAEKRKPKSAKPKPPWHPRPVCVSGKTCRGTHPLICGTHGCAIEVARASKPKGSDWLREMEAALGHAEQLRLILARTKYPLAEDALSIEDALRYDIALKRGRSHNGELKSGTGAAQPKKD